MEQTRFGVMTRMMRRIPSRRDVLRGLVGAGLGFGFGILQLSNLATARKKRQRKRRIKRNDFGCVNVGNFCKNNGQCCSGICKGKKDRKKCKAHDSGGCTGEQHTCDGIVVPCVSATGENGACVRTTGNAGYCEVSGNCFPCTRDPDCQAIFGPQAACIVCETECGPKGTACVGPSEGE